MKFYRLKTSADYIAYKQTSALPASALTDGLIDTTTSHGLPHIAHAKGERRQAITAADPELVVWS